MNNLQQSRSPSVATSVNIVAMDVTAASPGPIDDTDLARARLYRLLGNALARPPGADLLAALASLDGGGDGLGDACRAIAGAARASTAGDAAREYNTLFIGMVRGELVPYASFYLTGFLYERPLARLRADMAELGLAAADGRADPEDHVATMLEIMSVLITDAPDRQHAFFHRHLEPWAGRFFADLEACPAARLYRPIGALGRWLIDLDRAAFALEFAA